jgi:hypothetical protein
MTPSQLASWCRGSALARSGRLALLATVLWLGACSADAVVEPEPTIETKGAFIAVVVEGKYELLRTLTVFGANTQDETLFVVPYLVEPNSFEHARELAKDPTLPKGEVIAIGKRYIVTRDWRVVWFRSVSLEEEAEFR